MFLGNRSQCVEQNVLHCVFMITAYLLKHWFNAFPFVKLLTIKLPTVYKYVFKKIKKIKNNKIKLFFKEKSILEVAGYITARDLTNDATL